MRWLMMFTLGLVLCVSSASAAPHEAALPLTNSKLRVGDLTATLHDELHLPSWARLGGEIDLSGIAGSKWVDAMNQSLGDGCRLSLEPDRLVLHVDAAKLPHGMYDAEQALRIFTAVAAPDATAAQQRTFGLMLPKHVDPNQPIVVLVRGLDANCGNWMPIAGQLEANGYQVALFNYPDDMPISENASLLAANMKSLHEAFPDMHVDLIAHSMGGLISRGYIEGADYDGGIDHFIMLGTPNHGTRWTKYRIFIEAQRHYEQWRYNPDWRPSWIITEGLGGVSRDLKPGSAFLKELNSGERRAGVKYTIVAGNKNPANSVAADCVAAPTHWLPTKVANTWGIRQARAALTHEAVKLRAEQGKSDGPVTIESAKLQGVDDFVIVPADHITLYCPATEVWDIIQDRLSK